jgi:hypothetical protein
MEELTTFLRESQHCSDLDLARELAPRLVSIIRGTVEVTESKKAESSEGQIEALDKAFSLLADTLGKLDASASS